MCCFRFVDFWNMTWQLQFIDKVSQRHMIYMKEKLIIKKVMLEFVKHLDHRQCFLLCSCIFTICIIEEPWSYVTSWSHVLLMFWVNIAPIATLEMSICTWNSLSQCGAMRMGASIYFCFIISQASWNFAVHMKASDFCINFVIGTMMKVLHKTIVKLS